jgi:hypothetical protein
MGLMVLSGADKFIMANQFDVAITSKVSFVCRAFAIA